ncbi:MAG TPA: hypothetical protein VF572_05035 [Candidatus Saccharimonadales bacterium]|jgi:hypothetical protein
METRSRIGLGVATIGLAIGGFSLHEIADVNEERNAALTTTVETAQSQGVKDYCLEELRETHSDAQLDEAVASDACTDSNQAPQAVGKVRAAVAFERDVTDRWLKTLGIGTLATIVVTGGGLNQVGRRRPEAIASYAS